MKHKQGFTREEIGIMMAALVVAVLMLIAPKVMGVAYYWAVPQYNQFGVNYDSLVYRIRVGTTTRDSSLYSAADTVSGGYIDDSVSVDSDSQYVAEVRVYDGSWGDWGTGVIPVGGVSGGLSSADYDSIETRVTDGSGPYLVSVSVRDTTGGGSVGVSSAIVTFRDPSLVANVRQARTNTSGVLTFYTTADTLAVIANMLPYYVFPTWDTIYPPLGASTQIQGYSFPDTAGSAADRTCLVKVYVVKNDGTAAEKVKVTASIAAQGRILDSAGHAIVNVPQEVRTDSLGIARFLCMWSSYFVPAADWNFNIQGPGFGSLTRQITVPRDTVHTINLLTD